MDAQEQNKKSCIGVYSLRISAVIVIRVVTKTQRLSSHKPRIDEVFLCLLQRLLAALCNQSYLCVMPNIEVKDMLNQQDMTEMAKAVFNELSDSPATVGEIAQNTHLTHERCQ